VDGLAFGVDLAGLRASAAAVLDPARVTSVDRVRKPGVERADRNVHASVAVPCVAKGEWSVHTAVGASGVCGREHNICAGARVRQHCICTSVIGRSGKLAVYEVGIVRVDAEIAHTDLVASAVRYGQTTGPTVLVRRAREAATA
jgi:hypothetical protein